MKIRNGLAVGVMFAICGLAGTSGFSHAQGTKVWTVERYDEMERGTASGVAIRSDGRIEAGPATSLLYETGGNYVWSVAVDGAGNAYVGMGGTSAGGAVVMRVAPDGKATKVFEGKELGVQALRVGSDGHVYAATSPDGKVYRLGATTGDAAVVFDASATEEKPKYLWDVVEAPGAAGKAGDLYVAAGAPAVVYRLPAGGGKAVVAFKTVDQHIRCLLMGADGRLWAGSDGSGVIYRLETTAAGPVGKPFAVYAAPKKEITSLAMDGAGNVYAAGVGTRPAAGTPSPGLPPLPVTGAVGVTITFSQPGSANSATANTLIPEGSDIYKIATDGSPEKLLSLKDDVVYALAYHDGSLLAATGNRGRVYRVDTAVAGQFTDVAHLEAAQGMAFASGATSSASGPVLIATSNSGKVYRMDGKPAANATYMSEVFDAQGFSQWGRLELLPEAATGFDLFVRSGNVESPLMGWSEWAPVANTGAVTVPGGRFAQWKAVLRAGASLQSVGLNYLQKNLAPVVDDVVVQPGARVAASVPQTQNQTVQVSFPAAAGASPQMFVPDANSQPLQAQKDRTAVTVRWAAHDDNGDDLMFAVWYRGVGEKNWRLLKDKISDRFYSFDASLLPDGRYEAKVVASDAPVHTDAETLTGERVSGEFVVDTTAPVVSDLHLSISPLGAVAHPSVIHVTAIASDLTSPIAHAEYSVDAGPWQYVEPANKLSDSRTEQYSFDAPLSGDYSHEKSCASADNDQHILALRAYDRYENVGTAKASIDRLCIVLTTHEPKAGK
jgi:outer membrane protein assembly factor BamB